MSNNEAERTCPRTLEPIADGAIATLSARTRKPAQAAIDLAVRQARSVIAPGTSDAHCERLAAFVATYFRELVLPEPWVSKGAHVRLGAGVIDHYWSHPDGSVILETIETGPDSDLYFSMTPDEVMNLCTAARVTWGVQFVGLRLLSTCEPQNSLLLHPRGAFQRLDSTPFAHNANET